MKSLRDQVAIVTGASSGIGQATAYELARRGAKVVLAARRVEALTVVQQEIEKQGGTAIAIPTDVAEVEPRLALVQQTIAAYGQIDLLVNNAGIGAGKSLTSLTAEQIAHAMQVNLQAPIQLTRAVLPGMLERRHGVIISVASVAGAIAIDSLYSATKFGLRGFSLGLHRQLQGTGVHSCVILPGFIRTAMNANRPGPLPGPETVAKAIAKLAIQPRRELVFPRYYAAFVWIEQQWPWLVDRAIAWAEKS